MSAARRPITWREGAAVTLFAIALTVYFTWPLALNPAGLGRLAPGDGQFSVWNSAWVAHAFSTGQNVFDANIFHPHKTTLAFSEANLGAGLLALPAYLLTGNPYAAHNSAVLIGLTFSVIGMYLLGRRLTGNLPASLVAAVLFAFCPFLFARTAHIQLMMTAPFPLVLLAFHVFADETTVKRAVILGFSIAVQALFCAYYGVLVGLMVGVGVLVFAIMRGTWRQPRWWYLTALAAAVSLALVLPFFLPYIRLQDETGFGRSLDDARRYSANWQAYFASSANAHRWMLPPDRFRLNEQLRYVPSKEIAIGEVHPAPPHPFLDQTAARERGPERVPQVVILAHRVIEPADMLRVTDRVAREPQADHLVDRLAVRHRDVRQPRRQVRGGLSSEPVLRRDDDVGVVAGVTQCIDQGARDHHVPTLDHGWARRDDSDARHLCNIEQKPHRPG